MTPDVWAFKDAIKDLLIWGAGQFWWFFLILLFNRYLQRAIDDIAAGIQFRHNTELTKGSIVIFDGREGWVYRLGWLSTDFVLYKKWREADTREGAFPMVSTRFTIKNSKLDDHIVEVFMEKINKEWLDGKSFEEMKAAYVHVNAVTSDEKLRSKATKMRGK